MEHWVSGGVEDHGPNEDGYHVTVRSHGVYSIMGFMSLSFKTLIQGQVITLRPCLVHSHI